MEMWVLQIQFQIDSSGAKLVESIKYEMADDYED